MKRLVVALIVLGALLVGAWLVFGRGLELADFELGSVSPRIAGGLETVTSTYVVPALADNYRNEEFRFSLRMPDGFTAAEIPGDGVGRTIVLQNQSGEGIQIYITPGVGDSRVLTADMVRADIPDMEVTGVQEVEIGDDYRGVAFLSDNEAFGGSSREVWFFFRGNLYQISTYVRLDNLLQSMFATWKFF